MRPLLAVADGLDKSLFEELKNNSQWEVHPKSKLERAELLALIPQVHGLVVRSATQVNSELLEKATQLKYVVRAGEGVDNIDLKAAQARGVKVANTPGANNNSAAEHAVALMMALLRHVPHAHESMKRGEWEKNLFVGNELTFKTVGIVGFGRIGKLVAKRIAGFEPKVLFFDPFVKSSDLSYARYAELEEIFSQSDIISVHVPLMESTRNFIDRKLLGMMKPSAILINAARGGLVNEQDLFDILSAGKIRAAAFDVFKNEPLEKESRLRELKNFIMTPHLGASTQEAQFRVGEMVVHQLKEFFLNNNLLNEVKR